MEQDYKTFQKLGKDKAIDYINKAEQSDRVPMPEICDFPDLNFMTLKGIQDKKQIKLATYRFPAKQTKAVLVYYHTLGSYIGIAGNLGKQCAENGVTLVGYDQRGHGRSEGEKGYFDDAKDMIKNSKTFIAEIAKLYPSTPIFLMGQGLGGLMALLTSRQIKDFKLGGLILAAPSLKKPSHSKVISALSDFALKLMPNKAGIFELKFQTNSRNPNSTDYLHNNPNMYKGKICAGSLYQLTTLLGAIPDKQWSKATQYPLMMIQGKIDKVVNPLESIEFYEKLEVKDKTLEWFPEMWHNFFIEQESEKVIEIIKNWVLERSK